MDYPAVSNGAHYLRSPAAFRKQLLYPLSACGKRIAAHFNSAQAVPDCQGVWLDAGDEAPCGRQEKIALPRGWLEKPQAFKGFGFLPANGIQNELGHFGASVDCTALFCRSLGENAYSVDGEPFSSKKLRLDDIVHFSGAKA